MRYWAFVYLAVLVTIPALFFRFTGYHLTPLAGSAIFGLGILAAAFLLTWGAEAAEVDISQGLAIAIIALVTVLPEYSVDLYFAWEAGKNPSYAPYAVANMTGGNRLLVGLGWSLVALLFFLKSKKRYLELGESQSGELFFLGFAALYGLNIFFKASIHWVDSIVLVGLFIAYLWMSSRGHVEEPTLGGPSASIASLPTTSRRSVIGLLLLFSAVVILSSAKPFADGLVETGKGFGIDEFVLVQWIAPLASESPEIIVATLFALKGNPVAGISAVISATVNQWTLLIGSIPIVYSISLGSLGALHMDGRQTEEVLLTAAQALAGVVLVSRLRMSLWDGLILFLLFSTQLFFPDTKVRYAYTAVYLGIAILFPIFHNGRRAGVRSFIPRALKQIRFSG